MPEFDEFDAQNIAYKGLDFDEIDMIQSAALLSLIDQWKKNELYICDVAEQLERTMGLMAGYSLSYRIWKKGRTPGDKEFEEKKQDLLKSLRPEALEHKPEIIAALEEVQGMAESGEHDSWEIATSLGDILFLPADHSKHARHRLYDYRDDLKIQKKIYEARKPDIDATIKAFRPITEQQVKKRHARKFAYDAALKIWEKEQEKSEKPVHSWDFSEVYYEQYPERRSKDADVPFVSPVDDPGRKLCNTIEIAPSGTAMIELFDRDQGHSWEEAVAARMTTYAVNFVPKRESDLETLQHAVQQAMDIIKDTRHPYDKSRYWDYYNEQRKRTWVDIKDGKVSPHRRLDLDDLQLLYYLLEPVIEPSAQIAAAMNLARYNEERGSPLNPSDSSDYESERQIDPTGALNKEDGDLLGKALKDAVVDLALNKTDTAGFMARIHALTDQSLLGRIHDYNGAFPSFDRMLEQKGMDGLPITYESAMKERSTDFLKIITGIPKDSDAPLMPALHKLVDVAKEPLREKFRNEAETERRAIYDRINADNARRRREREKHGGDFFKQLREEDEKRTFDDMFKEHLSDQFAKRVDPDRANMTDEQREKADKNMLMATANIIIRDTEVEPCIDMLHYGFYQSKTKGSSFVRYELPETLKPFVTAHQHRPNPVQFLSGPA